MKHILTFLMTLMLSTIVVAHEDPQNIYHFHSPDMQQRFEHMTEELRCLVCQNESIAESTAPLAKDLREQVYTKIQGGYSDAEIKKYLVDRYGQFILFKPAFSVSNLGLWTFPFLILIAGLLMLFLLSGRKKTDAKARLSKQEQEKINDLMELKDT